MEWDTFNPINTRAQIDIMLCRTTLLWHSRKTTINPRTPKNMAEETEHGTTERKAVDQQQACSASCRTCKHWCEQNEGFGPCANAANRELLRVLGGYMLCNAAYGCVLHEPNEKAHQAGAKE